MSALIVEMKFDAELMAETSSNGIIFIDDDDFIVVFEVMTLILFGAGAKEFAHLI